MFSLLQASTSAKYRPTASAGTITNAALAYDVDASPWATKADRALVTGSAVSGTADSVSVTYNGFAAITKAGFNTCNLQIVLNWTGGTTTTGTGTAPAGFNQRTGVSVDYRADGGTYLNLAYYDSTAYSTCPPAGTASENYSGTKVVISKAIPSSAFTANLSNLDIRFTLTTLTVTNGIYQFVTNGSYSIWDIQVNLV